MITREAWYREVLSLSQEVVDLAKDPEEKAELQKLRELEESPHIYNLTHSSKQADTQEEMEDRIRNKQHSERDLELVQDLAEGFPDIPWWAMEDTPRDSVLWIRFGRWDEDSNYLGNGILKIRNFVTYLKDYGYEYNERTGDFEAETERGTKTLRTEGTLSKEELRKIREWQAEG